MRRTRRNPSNHVHQHILKLIQQGAIDKAPVVNLEQGWTTDTQQLFYFTDQGSRIMPYAWFLALEQAENEKPFRSDQNIASYRYLTAKPTDKNPDGLPVGFAKHVDSDNQEEWVGMTCAACHTTQISYKGVSMRIEGGPTLADFETFKVFDLLDRALVVDHVGGFGIKALREKELTVRSLQHHHQ